MVVAMPNAAQTPADSLHASIEKALDASAAAWTAGDLETFMKLYEHSPTVRYINPKGVTVGYDAIQSMYAARFHSGNGASMGQLSLQLIDVKEVGPNYAFVIGRYSLKPATGDTVSGITTLLFHKVGQQWLIVVDHTS
jgi:ketosteroid isomerase-like protein